MFTIEFIETFSNDGMLINLQLYSLIVNPQYGSINFL